MVTSPSGCRRRSCLILKRSAANIIMSGKKTALQTPLSLPDHLYWTMVLLKLSQQPSLQQNEILCGTPRASLVESPHPGRVGIPYPKWRDQRGILRPDLAAVLFPEDPQRGQSRWLKFINPQSEYSPYHRLKQRGPHAIPLPGHPVAPQRDLQQK